MGSPGGLVPHTLELNDSFDSRLGIKSTRFYRTMNKCLLEYLSHEIRK